MRTIERANSFKRDYRRVKANPRHRTLDHLLQTILVQLVADIPLPPASRDHALSGNWNDCRECHIKPDLLLIYRKTDANELHLVRLGSHSDLFG